MAKFNLKNYQEVPGDKHIEKRLEENRGNIPNEINEKQLESHRADEPTVLVEKQLDKVREGAATEVVERRLDNKKANFDIKYRNPGAFEGDINKLEEKRLLGDPVENEKYEPASETPKQFRWWEDKDSPDGLKLANTKKNVKISQALADIDVDEDFDSPEEAAISPIVEEGDEEEDFEIADVTDVNNIDDTPSLRSSKIQILKQKDIKGPIPGIYMVLGYKVADFPGSDRDIVKAALAAVLSARPELTGLISEDDFVDPEESGANGLITLRAAGDKFGSLESLSPSPEADVLAVPSEISRSDINMDSFDEVDYAERDMEGTPMAIGKIDVNVEVTDQNRKEIIAEAIKYILNQHPNLNIGKDSLDVSKLGNGEIGYMSTISTSPIEASSDFEIIVKSQSSKKK